LALFRRRPQVRVDSFVIPASENLHKRRHGIASANEKRPPQLAASFPILELTWARLCTQMAGYIENAETPETA
jgi:hypothetical protein